MVKARPPTSDPAVDALRREIDDLDRKLLELLGARLDCARRIGAHKASKGAPVFVAPREKAVLNRLASANRGAFPADSLRRIYREIFSASRRAEQPLVAAYAGADGSLAHAAAAEMFGEATGLVPAPGGRAALRAVARGDAHYGVLPALCAPEGVGTHALLHLLEFDLHLVAEFYQPLDLVIALPPRRKAPKRVFVPVAFAEIAGPRLAEVAPGVVTLPAPDCASATGLAAATRGTGAVVPTFVAVAAGQRATRAVLGRAEGLRVRYLVASPRPASPTGADKTSVAFGLTNEAGNLIKALRPFSRRRINVDLLTAAPAGTGSREDLFFLDFEGHIETEKIERTVREMAHFCSFVQVLGSYPVFDPSVRLKT